MKKLALALAVTGAMVAGSAQALLIDDFNTGSTTLVTGVAEGPTNDATATSAVGASRTVAITGGDGVTQRANNGAATGKLAHSQESGTSGQSTVTWNANGAGLAADLTDGSINDALQLNIDSIDQGAVSLTFDVSDGVNTSTLVLSGLGVGPVAFLFSAFTGTADFTSVQSVVLTIDAGTASDLTLDLIQTRQGTNVPVPGTLALFGLGLAAAGFRRKKAA